MSAVHEALLGKPFFDARLTRRRQGRGLSCAASSANCSEVVGCDTPSTQGQHARDGNGGKHAALQRLACGDGYISEMQAIGEHEFRAGQHRAQLPDSHCSPLAPPTPPSDSSADSSLSPLSSSEEYSASGTDDSAHHVVWPASELLHRSGPVHESDSVSSDDWVLLVHRGNTPSADSDKRRVNASFFFVDSDELREREAAVPSVRELGSDEISLVPLDHDGNYTSVGSIGHNTGHCAPPCTFVCTTGCRAGIACMFCHFPHKGKSMGKRRHYKKKKERRAEVHDSLPQRDSHSPMGGSERHARAASSEMASSAVAPQPGRSRQLISL